jgi:hypothetical protein
MQKACLGLAEKAFLHGLLARNQFRPFAIWPTTADTGEFAVLKAAAADDAASSTFLTNSRDRDPSTLRRRTPPELRR